MPKVLVLGAGMVGKVIAADLAADPDYTVLLADVSDENLARAARETHQQLHLRRADLSNAAEVTSLAKEADVVCGALASHIGFNALRAVIEAGKPYCDISFMPEDAMDLDGLAKDRGVTAVVDCGVAPGMSNLLAGAAAALLDPCDSIEIYVGGLPIERRRPFEYKAGFAPADVIEEYTRPARIVENGRITVREALSEPEPIDFAGLGTLEAFNTDGLRSLAYTLRDRVPSMKEKTLRYPGHAGLMKAFRDAGLFSKEPVMVRGTPVRPLDLTSAVLFPKWTYEDDERDLTVMRVTASGERDGVRTRIGWDLFDTRDMKTGFTSMSRTTAFPCAIIARMLATGALRSPGVRPPELLATHDGLLKAVLKQLGDRGVEYAYHEQALD